MPMKKLIIFALILIVYSSLAQSKNHFIDGQKITITKKVLQDKIKGGWAGQTIGVTFGGPYEFRFLGSMIQDYQKMQWAKGQFKYYYSKEQGLYDDIYMDLSFVDVIDKYGVDAPVDSFANAFAHASYPLWHANQAGRYNVLNGIKAPASGYWKNNPHSDDIDFQIEADFAGLMFPGMAVSSSKLCDKVGHIMNYGDGYYGGLYVASLYTQAFVSNDINWIVASALEAIPKQSNYYKCISDVIKWHQLYPNDWKKSWFEIQQKWTSDIGCTDGVFKPFDISANVNSAYVIMGLLYGGGDFEKTMEIAIRCGQDADCNPATAAGVLGTIIGYDNIPKKWIQDLIEVEDDNFGYTNISLTKMYAMGYRHASEMIQKNGGSINENTVSILYQKPIAVKFEKSFENLIPTDRKWVGNNNFNNSNKYSFDFTGTGINLSAGLNNEWGANTETVYKIEVNLDGKKEIVAMPFNFKTRKPELYFNYNLKEGSHHVELTLLNPDNMSSVNLGDIITYSY
jgi:hypothetical protein